MEQLPDEHADAFADLLEKNKPVLIKHGITEDGETPSSAYGRMVASIEDQMAKSVVMRAGGKEELEKKHKDYALTEAKKDMVQLFYWCYCFINLENEKYNEPLIRAGIKVGLKPTYINPYTPPPKKQDIPRQKEDDSLSDSDEEPVPTISWTRWFTWTFWKMIILANVFQILAVIVLVTFVCSITPDWAWGMIWWVISGLFATLYFLWGCFTWFVTGCTHIYNWARENGLWAFHGIIKWGYSYGRDARIPRFTGWVDSIRTLVTLGLLCLSVWFKAEASTGISMLSRQFPGEVFIIKFDGSRTFADYIMVLGPWLKKFAEHKNGSYVQPDFVLHNDKGSDFFIDGKDIFNQFKRVTENPEICEMMPDFEKMRTINQVHNLANIKATNITSKIILEAIAREYQILDELTPKGPAKIKNAQEGQQLKEMFQEASDKQVEVLAQLMENAENTTEVLKDYNFTETGAAFDPKLENLKHDIEWIEVVSEIKIQEIVEATEKALEETKAMEDVVIQMIPLPVPMEPPIFGTAFLVCVCCMFLVWARCCWKGSVNSQTSIDEQRRQARMSRALKKLR